MCPLPSGPTEEARDGQGTPQADVAVDALRATIIALVRSDTRDLTARQLAVFLTCYLNDEGQTVRGLAAHLKVGKAAITRALDRLENSDLAKRKPDQSDRPNLWVGRTASGIKFLRDVKAIVQKAGASANPTPGS